MGQTAAPLFIRGVVRVHSQRIECERCPKSRLFGYAPWWGPVGRKPFGKDRLEEEEG